MFAGVSRRCLIEAQSGAASDQGEERGRTHILPPCPPVWCPAHTPSLTELSHVRRMAFMIQGTTPTNLCVHAPSEYVHHVPPDANTHTQTTGVGVVLST